MRRVLFLLLLMLGTPLLPLLAASSDSDAGLPTCCRRNGAHHCTMAERSAGEGKAIAAPRRGCPFMPVSAAPVSFHVEASSRPLAVILPLPAATRREGTAQTEVRRRIAAERARQKRGPPAAASQASFL